MNAYVRIAAEQHDSLPGIPDPAENPVLCGHEEILGRLLTAFRTGRMHHALLLHGPRGIGKATLAFHFARHLLGGTDPASPAFRQMAMGAHPGLLHLSRPLDRDGRKFRMAITVDEVRRIGGFLGHTSHDASYRVIIIDPADDMNVSAANALLKNLEEPPERSLFILVSHRPGGLLPTIRSRCQAIRLQPLSEAELLEALRQVGAPLPEAPEQLSLLAAQAAGSPRNAILSGEFGGFEMAQAMQEVLQSRPFDMEKAHRLGNAVSMRGSEVQFALLNEQLLEQIASRARQAGEAGNGELSARLAELWQSTQNAIRQTEALNLDRKQHVVAVLLALHELLDRAAGL